MSSRRQREMLRRRRIAFDKRVEKNRAPVEPVEITEESKEEAFVDKPTKKRGRPTKKKEDNE